MSTFGRSEAQKTLEFNAPAATVAKACQEVLAKLGEVLSTSPTTGSIHGIVKQRRIFGYDTDIMIQIYKYAENQTTLTIDASRPRFAATPDDEASVDLIKFMEALMQHPEIRNATSAHIGWVEEKPVQNSVESAASVGSPGKSSNKPLIWALALIGLAFASCCCVFGLYQVLSRVNF